LFGLLFCAVEVSGSVAAVGTDIWGFHCLIGFLSSCL
jgi:hypothetical protein